MGASTCLHREIMTKAILEQGGKKFADLVGRVSKSNPERNREMPETIIIVRFWVYMESGKFSRYHMK